MNKPTSHKHCTKRDEELLMNGLAEMLGIEREARETRDSLIKDFMQICYEEGLGKKDE